MDWGPHPSTAGGINRFQHLSSALHVCLSFVCQIKIHIIFVLYFLYSLSFLFSPFPPSTDRVYPPSIFHLTTFTRIQECRRVYFIPISKPPLPSFHIIGLSQPWIYHPIRGFFSASTSDRIEEYLQRFVGSSSMEHAAPCRWGSSTSQSSGVE